ncbi:MAG: hypothetical protein IJM45_10440 [Clostridia bacterium]|nr:hypothetical protein [Clostridia bacterium]
MTKNSATIEKLRAPLTRRNAALFYGISLGCFALLAAYMVWYIHRGMGAMDESMYLNVAHRLLQGDRLLIDEWHVSQFSAPLVYLPFRIYYSLRGTEGIILFFRYLYLIAQFGVSLFAFFRLRKYGFIAAVASLMYCRYTVMNCPALSYYTMSLMSCTLICLLLFTGDEPKKPLTLLITGLLTGAAVLSEPLLAVFYFIYVIAVAVSLILKKKRKPLYLLDLKSFLFITAGIVVSAAAFFAFLLSRGSLSEYLSALPNFFTDSEYRFPLLSGGGQNLFDAGLFNVLSKIWLPFFIADAVLFIAVLADRKRLERRLVYIAAAAVLAIATYICILIRMGVSSRLMYLWRHIPLFIFGAFCCLLLENKKEHKRLIAFYAAGIPYSAMMDVSSENYLVVCMLGGVISNIAVFIFAKALLDEIKASGQDTEIKINNRKNLRIPAKAVCALLCVLIWAHPVCEAASLAFEKDFLLFENICGRSELYVDSFSVYGGAYGSESPDLSEKLTAGPLKGIYTLPQAAEKYDALLRDLNAIRDKATGPVYVFGLFSWMYMSLDKPYSAYTAWFIPLDFETRQIEYWDLHPQRSPEYIYIPRIYHSGFHDFYPEAAERLEKTLSLFECEVETSEVGYTIRILGRKYNV